MRRTADFIEQNSISVHYTAQRNVTETPFRGCIQLMERGYPQLPLDDLRVLKFWSQLSDKNIQKLWLILIFTSCFLHSLRVFAG